MYMQASTSPCLILLENDIFDQLTTSEVRVNAVLERDITPEASMSGPFKQNPLEAFFRLFDSILFY